MAIALANGLVKPLAEALVVLVIFGEMFWLENAQTLIQLALVLLTIWSMVGWVTYIVYSEAVKSNGQTGFESGITT